MGLMKTAGRGADLINDLLFPQWEELRPVATSYAAIAALPLSIIGYLLLLNQHALEWAELAPTFRFFWPGTPWRLVATYYGLVVLALGALVFRLKCPSPQKGAKDVIEFTATTMSAVLPTHERTKEFTSEIASQLMHWAHLSDYPDFKAFQRIFGTHSRSLEDTKGMIEAGASMIWIVANESSPGWRCTCRLFLATGIAILAIPAIATFVEVTIWLVLGLFGVRPA